MKCTYCGHELNGMSICPHCHAEQPKQEEKPKETKEKQTDKKE